MLSEEPFFAYVLQSVTSSYGPVAEARAELLRARLAELLAALERGSP